MSAAPSEDDFAPPFIHRTRHTKALHFSIHEVQSMMRTDDPTALALAYTRLMMGFLLFHPAPTHIGMLGLGGGSLVKFCHRHLPQSAIEVVEINPHVLALRNEFEVPEDDERLSILNGNGAAWVRRSPERFDVLLVDGFDSSGQPSDLATQRFYDDCSAALRPGGVAVFNLFRGHPQHAIHMDRLRRAFNDNVLEVEDRDSGANSAVLAGPALGERPHSADMPPPIETEAWDTLTSELADVRSDWATQRPGRNGSPARSGGRTARRRAA